MALEKDLTLLKSMGKKITEMRKLKFPGHGGAGRCIAAFYEIDITEITNPQRVKWNRWEKGKATPEIQMQERLAKFFGVSLSELRGEKIIDDAINHSQNHDKPSVELTDGGDITYKEKGDMSDTNIVEVLKDHIETLKKENADLRQEKMEMKSELMSLREENKQLLTLYSKKDTTQAGSG